MYIRARIYINVWIAVLALFLAACSSHTEELLTDDDKDLPLSFTTTVDGSETTTRATTPLQYICTQFEVWTRKNRDGQNYETVMEEYIVEHNGSANPPLQWIKVKTKFKPS